MRHIKLLLLFVTLLLLGGVLSFGQQDPEGFSGDPAMFSRELSTYFGPSNSSNIKQTLTIFTSNWDGGKFSTELQKDIIQASVLLRNERVRPNTGFADYLAVLNLFSDVSSKENIAEWHKAIIPLITNKHLKVLRTFLTSTTDFINNSVLFRSHGNSWQYDGKEFTYKYDSTLSVVLDDIKLVCISGRDSISIQATSGHYFPLTDSFKGSGGKVLWQKFSLSPEKVYAVLDNYEINLKQTSYKADTVNFYYHDYFKAPLIGSLEDRVLAGVSLDKATYPRFVSFNNDIGIKNIYKDIDYFGGFTIEGARIIGSGNEFAEAYIAVNRGGEQLIKISSKSFIIRPDRLVSQRASVIIVHDGDSMYHPGLQVRYLDENRELSMLRNSDGFAASPFFSSYHKIDMYSQALYYNLDSDVMSFEVMRGARRTETAIFESSNFYSEQRFNKIQGIDIVHPLSIVNSFAEKTKSKVFYLPEFVEFARKPYEQLKAMMINLANGGFVSYNIDSERIEVKQRLYDYLNARSKKADYDVIQINSNVGEGPNGVLDLKSFNITVKGVDSVSLSQIKAVNIIPRNKELIIGPNRDFVFTGMVKAGNITFHSNESSFSYDTFKLNMPQIDSIAFTIDTVNKKTNRKMRVNIKNVIASVSGELLIDRSSNKSGIKNLPVYPIFNSKTDSYVYFDREAIADGAYDREGFYYTVYPFSFDSLNSFTTKGLKFDGALYAGEIMATVEEPLRIMSDYSLGFSKNLGDNGIPVYDGRGTFYSRIKLDGDGFQGNGKLEYMTSMSESKDFHFYPDSLMAELDNFTMEATGEFPAVKASGVQQLWLPSLDVMRLVSNQGKEFEMFDGKTYHSGRLSLTSAGLFGSGLSRMDNADLASNQFTFKGQSFTTDTTDFKLYYPDRPKVSLVTRVNKGNVDFLTQHASFGVTGESQRIELPQNKYVCYMDKIEWAMDQSELNMTNSLAQRAELADNTDLKDLVDFDFSGSEFISTDPKRDSLSFFAMEATYNMKENIINAREVKMMEVADVAIFPGDGKITILSDGDMQPLEDATIIANRTDKYHRVYDVSVKVNSRNNYKASGTIDYTDIAGNVQPVEFNPVTVDSANSTYGVATVTPQRILPLNSHFNFMGQVKMSAAEKNMLFDGMFALNSEECLPDDQYWVRFTSKLDPSNIMIPIQGMLKDSLNDPIMFGVVYSEYFSSIYPALFEKPKAHGDTLIIDTKGYIRYDEGSQSYYAGDESRLLNKSRMGNLVSFETDRCILTADGLINMATNMGDVKVVTAGQVTQFTLVDSTRFNIAMALDFFFEDQAMERLLEDIQLSELGSNDSESPSFISLLTNLLGEKESESLMQEVNMTGQIRKLPPQLQQRIILNDLNLVWDGKLKSFISEGKIGIAGIQSNLVNRTVGGYVEIGKRRTGDILNIYLELNPLEWYYFSYSNGIMQAISSNNEFNSIIASIKENKRTTGSGQQGYQFIISTPQARQAFMRKMQSRDLSNKN